MQQINISELDIKSLKAIAYDELVKLETAQTNLKLINEQIARKQQEQLPVVEGKEVEEK